MADFSIRATPTGPHIVPGATELLDTVGDDQGSRSGKAGTPMRGST